MNELHLFAGAGGGILAGQMLGHRCVCAVEWEPYAAGVLVARQNDGSLPPFPIWDDVQTFDGRPWRGIVDIVAGGFPCQAYSSAASGKNNADDLWPEMRRIVADVAPRYVFAENVARRAIDAAAEDLEAMGYEVRCMHLSAADMGADHIRGRYWLLAHADMHRELLSPINAEARMRASLHAGVWSSNPSESGMDDGMEARMDRLKAIGNGQVPLCAAAAFRMLAAEFGG
jgi:DNA (cytosine-5)-methyltransferase 1